MAAIPYPKDFYGDEFILSPNDHYKEMRQLGRVLWLEAQNAYAVAHYDEVVTELRHPYLSTSGRGLSLNDRVDDMLVGSTLNSDEDQHRQQRSLPAMPIMPKSLKSLKSLKPL